MRGPDVRLGSTSPCLFHIIVFYPALRIGPYLFYIEKFTTLFKTAEKIRGHRSRFRGNDDLPLWRGPAVKKNPAAIF